jgi:thiamine pyrophosphate-dependent acetolactate synthase large subunit-like protein
MPELLSAKEQNLSLPIIIWENGGYKQIQDDMKIMNVDPVGVEGLNPDFVKLAEACYCNSVYAHTEELFVEAFKKALLSNSPTIIVVKENYDWLG